MFDIGFMELLLIGTVALLVLGPDKLPGAIRTGALWFGRAKRSFNSVKSEIEQQINADEIRRQLHNETILGDIEKARKNADKLIKDTQAEIKNTETSVKRAIDADGKTKASSSTSTKVTTSADEGIPTPPPESYQVPEKNDSRPSPTEKTADPVKATPATEPDPMQASEPEQKEENPAPAQDIYSTPPSGIVSMQNGKFSAANDKPKNPDSPPGKK